MTPGKMQSKSWWKAARYPSEYASGHTDTDKVYCPTCAPWIEQKWNGRDCVVIYRADVPEDTVCEMHGGKDA